MRGWNWRDPFTAYNCTWGFAPPADFPEPADGQPPCNREYTGGAGGGDGGPGPQAAGAGGVGSAGGVGLSERLNSTTCPRVMLCDYHVSPDGAPSLPLERASRCNLEGYAGLDHASFGDRVKQALAGMEGGRCAYPDGVTPNSPRGEIVFE
jgi:hypothetical protein